MNWLMKNCIHPDFLTCLKIVLLVSLSFRKDSQLRHLEKDVKEFEKLMNFSSMAWPTDWFSHLTKYYDAFFHLNPMSVAGDNASFVMDNVEFAKMFVLRQNWSDYDFGKK